MADQAPLQVKRIFFVSAGDLAEERNLFPILLEQVNDLRAHSLGIHLEPAGPQYELPGHTATMEIINHIIQGSHLVICAVGIRWGVPTRTHSRRTEEEFEAACSARKKIWAYFREASWQQEDDFGPQLALGQEFKARLEREASLWRKYRTTDQWAKVVTRDLFSWLGGDAIIPRAPKLPLRRERQKSRKKGSVLVDGASIRYEPSEKLDPALAAPVLRASDPAPSESTAVNIAAAPRPPPAPPEPSAPQQPSPPAQPEESYNPSTIKDQPSEKDYLGFRPYVEAMALFLSNQDTKPPLTVSVEGEWGSGKSSFMLQLEAELKRLDRERRAAGKGGAPEILTVRFNPWRHNHEEEVWAAFALRFIAAVTDQTGVPWRKRWKCHLRILGRRFASNDGLIDPGRAAKLGLAAVASGTAATLGLLQSVKAFGIPLALGGLVGMAALLDQARQVVSHPYFTEIERSVNAPDYASRIAFIERFHEHLASVIQVYAPNRRIYIFIDDLDRCDVPRAAELLQAINLMTADNPHLFFIMGLDREKVAAGIAVKHGDLLPFLYPLAPGSGDRLPIDPHQAMSYGYTFIEKFIQVPFALPRPRVAELENFLLSLAGSVGETTVAAAIPAAAVAIEPVTQPAAEGPTAVAAAVEGPSARVEEQKRREEARFIVQKFDSARVRAVAATLAPTFAHNPRRIVQFMNLYRLRIAIAVKTGLITPDPESDAFTLEQLGKFVALSLTDSALVQALPQEKFLLSELQLASLGNIKPEQVRSPAFARWARVDRVRVLLRAGCSDGDGMSKVEGDWSLANLDVNLLLEVAPQAEPHSQEIPPL